MKLVKDKKKLGACAIALLAVIAIAGYPVQKLYASYTSEKSGGDFARAAIFGHSESIEISQDWLSKLVPGNENTYTIEVTNKNGDKISEVAQSYEIEVLTAGNLPLEYTLTEDGTRIVDVFQETSSNRKYVFADNSMEFEAGTEGKHEYTLTVHWPDTEKNASLAGVPDYIQININVEQID